MKSAPNARPYESQGLYYNQNITYHENLESGLKDIVPQIYNYVQFIIDKNNFSLTCKKWNAISEENTKIITIFHSCYTDENLIKISQRFKNVEKFYISQTWKNLIECELRTTPQGLETLRFMDRQNFIKQRSPYDKNIILEPITDKGVEHFKCLSELRLSGTMITFECIKEFTNLKTLSLDSTENINNKEIKNLTNLTVLDLSHNSVIKDNGIENLTNLKTLILRRNDLITDKGLENLTNLTELNLENNDLITDSTIKILTNLSTLNLKDNNEITNSSVINATNLTKLTLDFCTRVGGNVGFSNLANLTSLSLLDTALFVAEDIIHLTHLSHLYLGNEDITGKDISTFTNLTSLVIHSDIDEVSLNELKNLTYLHTYSEVTEKGISPLTKLRALIIDGETKENITDSGIKFLTNLTHLDIQDTKSLTEACVTHLTNLTYLKLGNQNNFNNNLLLKNIKGLPKLLNYGEIFADFYECRIGF